VATPATGVTGCHMQMILARDGDNRKTAPGKAFSVTGVTGCYRPIACARGIFAVRGLMVRI